MMSKLRNIRFRRKTKVSKSGELAVENHGEVEMVIDFIVENATIEFKDPDPVVVPNCANQCPDKIDIDIIEIRGERKTVVSIKWNVHSNRVAEWKVVGHK